MKTTRAIIKEQMREHMALVRDQKSTKYSREIHPKLNLENIIFDDGMENVIEVAKGIYEELAREFYPDEIPQKGLKRLEDKIGPPSMMLTDANLTGVNAEGVDFRDMILGTTNFEGAALQGANFDHCNIAFAIFSRANLANAFLRDVDLFANSTIQDAQNLHLAFFNELTELPREFPKPPNFDIVSSPILQKHSKKKISKDDVRAWLELAKEARTLQITKILGVNDNHKSVTEINDSCDEYFKAVKKFKKELLEKNLCPVPKISESISPKDMLSLLNFAHNFWDINQSEEKFGSSFFRGTTPEDVVKIFGTGQGINRDKLPLLIAAARFGWRQEEGGAFKLTDAGKRNLALYLIGIAKKGNKRAEKILIANPFLRQALDIKKTSSDQAPKDASSSSSSTWGASIFGGKEKRPTPFNKEAAEELHDMLGEGP